MSITRQQPEFYSLDCISKDVSHLMFVNDRFSQSFYQSSRKKIIYVYAQTFPPHLRCAAALPCENRKSKNFTGLDNILNKLL